MQAALQILKMCNCFHLHTSLGCTIKIQAFFFFFDILWASNLISSWHSYVDLLFTNEEQKKAGPWPIWHFYHTWQAALFWTLLLETAGRKMAALFWTLLLETAGHKMAALFWTLLLETAGRKMAALFWTLLLETAGHKMAALFWTLLLETAGCKMAASTAVFVELSNVF